MIKPLSRKAKTTKGKRQKRKELHFMFEFLINQINLTKVKAFRENLLTIFYCLWGTLLIYIFESLKKPTHYMYVL